MPGNYMVSANLAQGSVRKQLDNKRTPLSWVQRAHIAVGAAQGLAYLHDLADPPVVHRDFKTSNILVMADYEARAIIEPVADILQLVWVFVSSSARARQHRKLAVTVNPASVLTLQSLIGRNPACCAACLTLHPTLHLIA